MPLLIFCIAATIYLLPAITAVLLGRRQQWAVLALNLLVGWTLVGWIAAMAWACVERWRWKPSFEVRWARNVARSLMARPANDNATEAKETETRMTTPERALDLPSEPGEALAANHYGDWLETGQGLMVQGSTSQGLPAGPKPDAVAKPAA